MNNASARPPSSSSHRPTSVLADMDPNVLVSEVEEIGIQWANADETANLLEETRKTLLAQYTTEYQRGSGAVGAKPLSMAHAEALAMADPRYQAHIENMVRARTQANRMRVRYDTGRVRCDMMRSLIATRREEARLAGMRT